ncbi:MAG: deoxyribose-phosphate aldolase [Thermoguttaceae bacterium]
MNVQQIASMIDLSAVRANSTQEDVEKVAQTAKKYGCIAAFSLPSFTPFLRDRLQELEGPPVLLGGTVGFPSGGDSTSSKVAQTCEALKWGCDEVDMVINIGFLLSGMDKEVEADIRAVKEAAGSLPLKVILECHYLTPEQIVYGTELVMRAGADWVKTGTGWATTGATRENIALIKSLVGQFPKIKAAGGVRDLKTLLALHDLGASRFGISYAAAESIFAELSR